MYDIALPWEKADPAALTVTLAVSHKLRPTRMAVLVAQILTYLPKESTVLLRAPQSGTVHMNESIVATMAQSQGLVVEWHAPETGGREQTFARDLEMIDASDYVIALFDPDHIMEGGTGHIVEAALQKGVPVHAWAIEHEGTRLTRVGEWHPRDT